ncbi:hypothetical protein AV530_003870 [Patagioenas fasciata monilis]|uniref:Uncharacterized protein n=1 Tax=Patagioenas fasciata monilis TaxID=372326 RepID=A0A1V4KZ01_PATFA|nr:hypothetical protein AV530_003870 [Patagioenas fasciata monilis]
MCGSLRSTANILGCALQTRKITLTVNSPNFMFSFDVLWCMKTPEISHAFFTEQRGSSQNQRGEVCLESSEIIFSYTKQGHSTTTFLYFPALDT